MTDKDKLSAESRFQLQLDLIKGLPSPQDIVDQILRVRKKLEKIPGFTRNPPVVSKLCAALSTVYIRWTFFYTSVFVDVNGTDEIRWFFQENTGGYYEGDSVSESCEDGKEPYWKSIERLMKEYERPEKN